MKKILVTGGAGFIGSALVDRLIEIGHSVVVVDSLVSGRKKYLNSKAKFVELDIRDDQLQAVFEKEKFDTVFHLAAQVDVRVSVENPLLDTEVNLMGALNVLENSKQFEVKKIVFASSAAVYGEIDQVPTNENSPTVPLSPYGVSKFAFEKYLECYYQNFDLNYTALRFSNVFGPRQFKGGEAGVVSIFIDNAVNGKTSYIFGDGFKKRDFIFVEDIVSALILADSSSFVGILNASTGQEHSINDVLELVSKSVTGEVKVEYKDEKAGDPDRSVLDNTQIKKQLAWQPKVSLEEGIKRTIKWSLGELNKK